MTPTRLDLSKDVYGLGSARTAHVGNAVDHSQRQMFYWISIGVGVVLVVAVAMWFVRGRRV